MPPARTATAASPTQSSPTPGKRPWARNGVLMQARAAVTISLLVISKAGITGQKVVPRHMRLALELGGVAKARPACRQTLVAALPQHDTIARLAGIGRRLRQTGHRSEEPPNDIQ